MAELKISEREALKYIRTRALALVTECDKAFKSQHYDKSYMLDKSKRIDKEIKRILK